MRCLRRNMTPFEYLPYTGNETDLNKDGEHTGTFRPEYGEPIEYRGHISVPSGQTAQQFYGEDIRYSHTLIMDKPDLPFDELGQIRWKGETYDIVAVRRSKNFLNVALRQQTRNRAEMDPPDPEPEAEESEDADGEEP